MRRGAGAGLVAIGLALASATTVRAVDIGVVGTVLSFTRARGRPTSASSPRIPP
jgi:hypothetical protein